MSPISRLRSLSRNLLHRSRVERDLDDEVRGMFDLLVDEKIRAGMRAENARRAAALELGSVEAIKEEVRDARVGAFLDTFLRDICYAWRWMRRDPGFTIVAALTLALGVGANTAIFTVVSAVVLKSLPVHDPERLVLVDLVTERGERQNISYPLFERLQAEDRVFAGVLAALDGTELMEIVGPERGAQPERAAIALVSGGYFDVLGVRALLGQTFASKNERDRGGQSVGVLSHGFWTRRFGADPTVIGTRLVVNKQPITVVGVVPQRFFGEMVGEAPDIWIPLEMQPRLTSGKPLLEPVNVGWLRVMARLHADVNEEQASAALAVVLARLKAEPSDLGRFTRHIARLQPSDGSRGFTRLRERFSTPLSILAVIVATVLLIACANIANLLLARASARQREMCVRLAIGAGRGRLIRQLLTESLLLAAAGGVLAVLFAWWGSHLLVALASGDGTAISIGVTPDAGILAFTATLSLVTVIIFGLAPALRASRVDAGTSFNVNAGASTRARLSQTLVVAQVALALVLLTAAGLFVQTLRNLRTRDLGFAADALLEIRLHVDPSSHEQVDLSRRLLDRLAATPGVQSASFAHAGFGTGISRTCCLAVEGYLHDPNEDREIRTLGVAPGYFQTLRLALLRGRGFTQEASAAAPQQMPSVAIVNEAFVRRYLRRDRDPIGARFGWGNPPNVTYAVEVIGVAADAIHGDLREDSRPLIYFPFLWGDTFVVRTAGQPEAVMATLGQQIRAIDPNLGASMRTVVEVLEREVIHEKLLSQLSTFFGVVGALLAAVGLYGIMAFAVVRRTREIGIRMALGAARGSVLRSELGSALRLVCYGIGAGAPAALVAGHLIENQLFGVSAIDPVTLAVVAVLLTLVAGVAAYVPARRAAGVEPVVALRCE